MSKLMERLETGEFLVADGAMGTQLLARGLEPGTCLEQLNLENRPVLEEIAELYLHTGADIICTNTFGGSPLKLARYGLEEQTEEINAAGVEIVRTVVQNRALVAGSCGPCGGILKPYGDLETDAVYKSFVRQIHAMVAAGIDILCVETMTDLTEAALAIRAAKAIDSSIPVCAMMSFDVSANGIFTIMGVGIEEAAEGLAKAGADVIGSNCGNGSVNMTKIAAGFAAATTLPIIIQSNAGLPEIEDGELVYPESPDFMAEQFASMLKLGVRIIGGCCGTTPDHVRGLRRTADRHHSQRV